MPPSTPIRVLKRSALAVAVLLFIILPAIIGGYEIFLRTQASRAKSDAPAADALVILAESQQGEPADPAKPDGWALLARACELRDATDERGWRSNPLRTDDGTTVFPDPSLIGVKPSESRSEDQVKYDAACEALARSLIDTYRADGVYAALADANTARRALPPLALNNPNSAAIGPIRTLARLNAGRMALALERKDLPEFAAAFESNLAIARLVSLQPLLLHRLVGNAVEALAFNRATSLLLTHPSDDWLDALDAAIDRQAPHVPLKFCFEGERLVALWTASELFSRPPNVRLAQHSTFVRDLLAINGAPAGTPLKVGTYQATKTDVNILLQDFIARSQFRRDQRPPSGAASPYLIPTIFAGAYQRLLESADQIQLERDGFRIMIALERFRNANQRYPDTLDQLLPRFAPQLPIDPWTGKPLGYRLIDPASDPLRRGYLLYSFGIDGADNGGRSSNGDAHRDFNALKSATPQSDYVLNTTF